MYNRLRLGELLVKMGKVTPDHVQAALRLQKDKGMRIGDALVELEHTDEASVAEAVAIQLDYPFRKELPLDDVDISLIEQLQLVFCREKTVLPFARGEEAVWVATTDPLAVDVLDEIRMVIGQEVDPIVMPRAALTSVINAAFDRKSRQLGADLDSLEEAETPYAEEAAIDINDLLEAGDDDEAPVIRFVNSLFVQSVRERASDIHIEPGEKEIVVRFRIDGVLKQVTSPPKRFASSIVTRIKIMAGLNIAEKRLPQDGRIRIKMAGKDIDIRVATAPMVHGERITMRLLDKSAVLLNIRDIGFSDDDLENLVKLIARPHGIILVTGPTGSGKTTTLYAILSKINSPDINIITIEDPVEYQLKGIGQIQVNSKIDLTFARGLRSIVRQDPDVILIGEMRDQETADIGVQSALTGHLVFSTLHTNDSASAITRLIDIGVEPFLISSSVIAVVAQRLVRVLCNDCKEPYHPDDETLSQLRQIKIKEDLGTADLPAADDNKITIYRSAGCPKCFHSGYKGRIGIYEIMVLNESLQNMIMKTHDSHQIKKEAARQGMTSLYDDGIQKVLEGTTTIEEVLRVTQT